MNHRPPLRPIALLLLSVVLRGGVAVAFGADEPASAPAPLPAGDTAELGAAGAMRGTPAHPAADSARAAADLAAEAKGLLALGNTLTERKDYEAAEIAYRRILGSRDYAQSQQLEALIGLARTYRRQGTHTKAAAIYEKFLKQFPDDERVPDVLLELGRTLRAMGANRMAIARFYDVINSTLKLPAEGFDHYELLARTAQFEIAETHFASGNFAEASRFFSRLRLLDLAPVDQARAHFKAAYALQLDGSLEGAAATLREYIDQWPQDEHVPEARYLLAMTLRSLNRKEEAMNVTLELLKAEKKDGNDDRRWVYWQRRTGNQLANDFFSNGDTAYALAIYQGLAALGSEPSWRLPISYQIGLCHERLHASDRARATYQAIVDEVARNTAAADEDLREIARMSAWRLENLGWSADAQQQLSVFFSTGGPRKAAGPPPQSPPTHDPDGRPAATPASL